MRKLEMEGEKGELEITKGVGEQVCGVVEEILQEESKRGLEACRLF